MYHILLRASDTVYSVLCSRQRCNAQHRQDVFTHGVSHSWRFGQWDSASNDVVKLGGLHFPRRLLQVRLTCRHQIRHQFWSEFLSRRLKLPFELPYELQFTTWLHSLDYPRLLLRQLFALWGFCFTSNGEACLSG